MKIGFYKLRRNSRYNYTPRYYKGKDTGNIYDFGSKFKKYKETANDIDFGAQWKEDRKLSRTRANRDINFRIVLIAAILIFIFLWIIDFDLSIFSTPF